MELANQLANQTDTPDKDKQTLNEILITAVVFGLTLNLISDLISSLPTLIIQLDYITLIWKIGWFVGSLVATLILLSTLSAYYLGNESRIEHEFRIALVWNTTSDDIFKSLSIYRPQMVSNAIADVLDNKSLEEIKSVVRLGVESLRKSDYPLRFVETILIKALSDLSNIDLEQLVSKDVSKIFPSKSSILRTIFNRSIHMIGKWTVSYKQVDNNESIIVIEWPRKLRWPKSSITFNIKVGQVDWFEIKPDIHLASFDNFYSNEFGQALNEFWIEMMKIDPYGFSEPPKIEIPEKTPTGYIRSDIHLRVKTNFSPLALQRGWGNTPLLLEWTKYLLNTIRWTLDWPMYLQQQLLTHQQMFQRNQQG